MLHPTSGKLSAREIFMAARAIPDVDQRKSFLSDHCGQDQQLRKIVVGLLATPVSKSSPLDEMVGAFGTEATIVCVGEQTTASDLTQLRQIGPYKLLEQIGQGGFGTVYMAEQTVPVRRKVALKILKPGMDSKEVIARFEAERQALAMMDHPNIARVIDGGTTETGRPYFVMELVRGIPLTEYCDEARLTTEERLKLFIDICKAVQHAHQKGIIHRDLKPSNVLVTMHDDKAVPKVIDFGIAKALSQTLTDRTLFTGYQQMLGTPLYMSPEQAQMSGIDIDTRSDVYSLGVMLYELLTGTTPFDKESLSKVSFDDLRKIIREQEPPRPSARITTLAAQARSTMADRRRIDQRRVSEELRGELDWIVMKALEKDRTRRYESVSAFAADLQRFLKDEPVLACPPALSYRLKKYARKNRIWLMTAATCTLMLMAASGISVAYAVQSQNAKQDAQEQREDAIAARKESEKRLQQSRVDLDRALKSLDTIVSEASSVEFSQLPGVEPVRAGILQKAMAFYAEIIADHDDDPYVRSRRAIALHNIAKIHEANGEAQRFLEEMNKAIAEMESVLGEFPEENLYRSPMVHMLFSRMHMGHQANSQRVSDAKRCLELTQQMKESGADVDPSWLALLTLKVAEMLTAHSTEADQYVDQSIRISSEAGIDPAPGAKIWLAKRDVSAGRMESAAANYKEGITLFDRLARDPSNRYGHVERCVSSTERSQLAVVMERLGNATEAEDLFRRSFDDSVVLAREYPAMNWYHEMLQARSVEFIEYLIRSGRNSEAEPIVAKLEESFPQNQTPHMVKARMFELSGDSDGARRSFEKADSLDPPHAAVSRDFGLFLLKQHDYEGAKTELEKSVSIEPGQWWLYKWLALAHFKVGEFTAALVELRRAVELNSSDLSNLTWIPLADVAAGPDATLREGLVQLSDEVVKLNNNSFNSRIVRFQVLSAFGRIHESIPDLRESLKAEGTTYYSQYQLALLSLSTNDLLQYRTSCQELLQDIADSEDPQAAHFIAWACSLGPAAVEDYSPAIRLARHSVEKDPDDQQYQTGLGAILFRAGQFEEAKTILERAKEAAGNEKTSPSYIPYFLAMTEHQLGNPEAAQSHLNEANAAAETERAGYLTWNRRQTLELLKAETTAMIAGPQ